MVEKAKQRFDEVLHTDEYKKIHADQAHLENLLYLSEYNSNHHYLDLGTGNGYIVPVRISSLSGFTCFHPGN